MPLRPLNGSTPSRSWGSVRWCLDSDDDTKFTVVAPVSGLRYPNTTGDDDDQGFGDDPDYVGNLDDFVEVESDVEGLSGFEEEEECVPSSSDWADVFANATDGAVFLPPPPQFLDQSAKLDKEYPDVESFLQDRKAEIEDYGKIVTSACRYITELRGYDFDAVKKDEFGKSIHNTWFFWTHIVNPDFVAKKALQAVPIQAAAALGMADFEVDDLKRLPHFPPADFVVYGRYFNHVTKTFTDKDPGHLEDDVVNSPTTGSARPIRGLFEEESRSTCKPFAGIILTSPGRYKPCITKKAALTLAPRLGMKANRGLGCLSRNANGTSGRAQ